MHFNLDGDIPSSNGKPLKLVEYLSSNISSTDSDVYICIGKAWTAIDRLTTIWKSDLSDKIKQNFFQTLSISVLLYGCTTWKKSLMGTT